MRRAYRFQLRPTTRQHVALERCLASHRELYNAALQERRDAWRLRRTGVSYGDQSAQLKEIRQVRPDVAVWSFSSQQATLRRLNRAFAGFYRRVQAGETPGYPRFKPAHRFDSVEWPKDGDGCRWQPDTRRVYLQGLGQVKVAVHRQVAGRVKTIQVRRQGRRWMLVLSCDEVPTRPLEPTWAAVGVDV
ncbi:MAG TPA: transposase, partial [Actinomycetes bacterium]|nr:transposase [Actinomycetes bacterium]